MIWRGDGAFHSGIIESGYRASNDRINEKGIGYDVRVRGRGLKSRYEPGTTRIKSVVF